MNGPLPSTRVFLSDLSSLPTGSKVRFLGCVRTYNISTGHLVLEHNYPRRKTGRELPSVSVDVNAVLEAVTWEELRVGAWVNVLGYVRRSTTPSTTRDRACDATRGGQKEVNGDVTVNPVSVDAVVVFSAGAIALGQYERTLHDSQEVEQRVQRPD